MRFRREIVANKLVANQMQQFFNGLDRSIRTSPVEAARAYILHLFDKSTSSLIEHRRFRRAQFHVAIGIEATGFDRLTKRAALVTDTLLLSHSISENRQFVSHLPDQRAVPMAKGGNFGTSVEERQDLHCYCPDLSELGRWLLAAEPLLRAGLAWYMPNYSLDRKVIHRSPAGTSHEERSVNVSDLIDFMQVGHRVIAVDDTRPVPTATVRPVVNDLELPFLDGVSLKEFSAITTGEFDSYQAFQSWLRRRLMDVDPALNAVESERELARIDLDIKDEVRALGFQMRAARKNRAVAATGAAVGTVSATLTAVLAHSQIAAVIAGFAGGTSASGGLWEVVRARTENSPRKLRESPWYYVWTLSRTDQR